MAIFASWLASLAACSAAFFCSAGVMSLNFCGSDCNWFIAPAKLPLARSRVASATGPLSSAEGLSVLNSCWLVEASENFCPCLMSSRLAAVDSCISFMALSVACTRSRSGRSNARWASALASSTRGAFCTDGGNAATLAIASWTWAWLVASSRARDCAATRRASRPNRSRVGSSHTASSSATNAPPAQYAVAGTGVGNWRWRLTFSAVRSASRTAAAANGSADAPAPRAYRAVLNFSASPSCRSMATAAACGPGRRDAA